MSTVYGEQFPATAIASIGSVSSSGTISSYARADHAHQGLYEIQIAGNTSGNSQSLHGSFQLAGGNCVTISGSSAAGALSLSLDGFPTASTQLIADWLNGANGGAGLSFSSNTVGLFVSPFTVASRMTAVSAIKSLIFNHTLNTTTNFSNSATCSSGFYFMDTVGSSYSLIASVSFSQSMSIASTSTGSSTLYNGNRTTSLTVNTTFELHPNSKYAVVVNFSASSSGGGAQLGLKLGGMSQNCLIHDPAPWGVSSSKVRDGFYNANIGTLTITSSALPTSIAFSNISISSTNYAIPAIVFAQ